MTRDDAQALLTLTLLFAVTLLVLALSAALLHDHPVRAVALPRGVLTSHYTTNPAHVGAATRVVSSPTGTLRWERDTGLQLPDGAGTVYATAELWLVGTSPRFYSFYRVNVRDGARLVPLCYAWVRHGTRWRAADYNRDPQPHGDDAVRTYDCDAVDALLRTLDRDMRGE